MRTLGFDVRRVESRLTKLKQLSESGSIDVPTPRETSTVVRVSKGPRGMVSAVDYESPRAGERARHVLYTLHSLEHAETFAIANKGRKGVWIGYHLPSAVVHAEAVSSYGKADILLSVQHAFKLETAEKLLTKNELDPIQAAIADQQANLEHLISEAGKHAIGRGRALFLPSGEAYSSKATYPGSTNGLGSAPTYRKALAALRENGRVRPATGEEREVIYRANAEYHLGYAPAARWFVFQGEQRK